MKPFSGEEKIYIWLDSFPLEEQEKRKLLKAVDTPKELLKKLGEVFPATIKAGKESVLQDMLSSLSDGGEYFKAYLSGLEKKGVTPIPFPSEHYPKALKALSAPPLVLYAKGNLSLLEEELFCVVGSRVTPDLTMKTGKAIAKDLSLRFTLVTGSADGGDSAAIEGALSGSGKIVCIPAGGFAHLPKSNLALFKKVEQSGLIVTLHPEFTPVRNFSYEKRNEILAALSRGVLVISAGEKSGTLVTANYASKAKKPVFALPYPPENPYGKGCNALIKEGAHLTETAEDIFKKTGVEPLLKKAALPALTQTEALLYGVLEKEIECNLSLLSEKTGIPAYLLTGTITALEVKGLVVKTGGNNVSIVR